MSNNTINTNVPASNLFIDPFSWFNGYGGIKQESPTGSTTAKDTAQASSGGLGFFGQGGNVEQTRQYEYQYNPVTKTTSYSNPQTTNNTYSTYAPSYSYVIESAGGIATAGAKESFSTDTKPSSSLTDSLSNAPSQTQSAEQGQTQGMSSPIEGLIILGVLIGGGVLLVKSGALKKVGGKK